MFIVANINHTSCIFTDAIESDVLHYDLDQIRDFNSSNLQTREFDEEMLVHLCYLFLGALVTQNHYADNIRHGVPLWSWATKNDIAFMLLILDNYYRKWEAQALGNNLIPEPTYPGRGLSSQAGQCTFDFLIKQVADFFINELNQKQFETKFQQYVNDKMKKAETYTPKGLCNVDRITALDDVPAIEWEFMV